jgi:hypothetical protein
VRKQNGRRYHEQAKLIKAILVNGTNNKDDDVGNRGTNEPVITG